MLFFYWLQSVRIWNRSHCPSRSQVACISEKSVYFTVWDLIFLYVNISRKLVLSLKKNWAVFFPASVFHCQKERSCQLNLCLVRLLNMHQGLINRVALIFLLFNLIFSLTTSLLVGYSYQRLSSAYRSFFWIYVASGEEGAGCVFVDSNKVTVWNVQKEQVQI